MSIGITGGDSNEGKNMPCLLGLHRRRETPMAKPKPLRVSDETRFEVLARANYKCERCGTDFLGIPISVHHRRPRMMGGSKDSTLHLPANLIVLCGTGTSGCHGWVEANRNEARRLGLLIQKVESAEEIPFQDKSQVWWRIDNNGQKTRLDMNWTITHA